MKNNIKRFGCGELERYQVEGQWFRRGACSHMLNFKSFSELKQCLK